MANKGGVITLKELITEDALKWGTSYGLEVDKAITKNKEFISGLKELGNIYKELKVSGNETKFNEAKSKEIKVTKAVTSSYKEQQTQVKRLVKLKAELLNADSKETKEIARLRVEKTRINKELREEATLTSKVIGAYQKLNLKRTQASKALRDLIARGKQANQTTKQYNAELKKAQTQFDKYNRKVKKADLAVKDFTKNVGNYTSAFGKAGLALRKLTSAFGLLGGVYLFVSALKDTIKRIRAFDKSMVDLASILRVNRKELKGVEDEIKAVAGASIKTTSEVADLATKLATLGKSKEEIIKLLKPINDLSIGMQATSEEAGELLITTLNAYGASADEAQHYSDVIANMRLSTALDFQRIRDAMSYIAPVAKTAGYSFENLGAMVGVLVDNSEKAEKAGRLLRTSILRLAKDGLSLEDALDKINEAQKKQVDNLELLSISGELFGKQSASIGIILANNRDRVAELTEKFIEEKDVLDELVNKQLESLDAKIKILDASWEALIIEIENGDGTLSTAFKNGTNAVTEFLRALTDVNKVTAIIGGRDASWWEGLIPAGVAIALIDRAGDLGKAVRLMKELDDDYKLLQGDSNNEIALAIVYYDKLAYSTTNLNDKKLYANQVERLRGLLLEKTTEAINQNTNANNESNESIKKTIAYYKDLIKAENEKIQTQATSREEVQKSQKAIKNYQNEIDKLLGTQKTEIKKRAKETKSLILGTEAWFESQISEMRKAQRETAGNSRAWGEFEKQIKATKKALKEFKEASKDAHFQGGTLDDFKPKYSDIINVQKTANEKIKNADKLNWEQRIGIAKDAISEIANISDTIFNARIEKIEAEKQANEDKYSHLMTLAKDDSEQQNALERERFAITQDLNKKALEEKKKQAKYNKLISAMDITLNTASSIMAMLKVGPEGIPLSISAGIMGAIQLATVLATPIPQYHKGIESTPRDELAKIGERGVELITEPSGHQYLSPDKETITYLQKGTKVTPHHETMMMLEKASIMASLDFESQKYKQYSNTQVFQINLDKLNGKIKEEIKQGFKNVSHRIVIKQSRDYDKFYRENTNW